MYTECNYIESLLYESLGYDMREEYAGLLTDWYGDDLTSFDPDDDDLIDAFRRLNYTYTFWKTSSRSLSPYQKLRLKYDLLLESYIQLIGDFKAASPEKNLLAQGIQKNSRKIVTAKIKDGCGSVRERRDVKNDRSDAA
jgi:hypothetical protein